VIGEDLLAGSGKHSQSPEDDLEKDRTESDHVQTRLDSRSIGHIDVSQLHF
jgi:hypothetical protein